MTGSHLSAAAALSFSPSPLSTPSTGVHVGPFPVSCPHRFLLIYTTRIIFLTRALALESRGTPTDGQSWTLQNHSISIPRALLFRLVLCTHAVLLFRSLLLKSAHML